MGNKKSKYETEKPVKNTLIFFIKLLSIPCNSGKNLIKQKDISSKCKDNLLWLYNSLEKSNGILKIKIETFEKGTTFQNELQRRYYLDFGNCFFTTFSKEKLVKSYGKPNKISISERDKVETYIHKVASKTCQDTTGRKCGVIYYEFDKKGKQKDGGCPLPLRRNHFKIEILI